MSKSCTESKFFFSFFFMWSIFASDMCIQPLLSFLCFFKVYKRWTNLSIKLPAPSRDFHFLRSHVSSHSPIIFAKSCQKLHACNWLKTEFRHQNWTLFTSCYALPCDNELKWFLKEQWAFLISCNYLFTIKSCATHNPMFSCHRWCLVVLPSCLVSD